MGSASRNYRAASLVPAGSPTQSRPSFIWVNRTALPLFVASERAKTIRQLARELGGDPTGFYRRHQSGPPNVTFETSFAEAVVPSRQ